MALPTTPTVDFEVSNENLLTSDPLVQISFIAAVTEKGDFNKPVLIYNYQQFIREFGNEIVPNGSISNIRVALELGSILRVVRVKSTTSGDPLVYTTTVQDWKDALDSLSDYDDGYFLGLSHLQQHLSSSDSDLVLTHSKTIIENSKVMILVAEIPNRSSTEGNPVMTLEEIKTWASSRQTLLGNSEFIAYMGGGILYYDDNNTIKECDSLGTYIGLANRSASTYFPWYSFAGLNRGLVLKAKGIVWENYGALSKYSSLNELANNYINVFTIQRVKNYGNRVVLWHNFTSRLEEDSLRFLNVSLLVIYMKRILTPILRSYIEEPNTFSTWSKLYYEVKPLLDYIKDNNGVTSYEWQGDQFATTYEQLAVNNEADVRSGIYKVKLRFKDVVSLQTINISLIIDKSTNQVEII